MTLKPVNEEPVNIAEPVVKPMSAQMKYYRNHTAKVSDGAKTYYLKNAERIKAKRNERYRLFKEAKNV
jgi:hypothetical protein